MTKTTAILLLTLLLLSLMTGSILAQSDDGQFYVVQANDTLFKISEKYLLDGWRYPEIVAATNEMAADDASFVAIDNPDLIEIGQKLWI
ncbi:MAG TPA: LysM peptidoglycan-binding domain-containing protein, partial [Chloroflexi bacterium]|nr:LysM peptidoglycan-binding domain-containing protein [Chloroflexota bacterium]